MLNSMSVHTPYLLIIIMAVCTGYTFWRILKFGAPVVAPAAYWVSGCFYHRRASHTRRSHYSRREIVDLRQSNFSVPETHVEDLPVERTWSEITAQYDREREMVAAYERTDSGQLRPLPFDTAEMPAIVSESMLPVRTYWGSTDTVPDVLTNDWPPYPTDPELDQFAYDGRRWAPTQVLEPVG